MIMPPVVKSLLIANLVFFGLDFALQYGMGLDLSAMLGLFYIFHPLFRVWQPLTYMFMHAGFSHLFFNMFALWMFGRIVEQAWGSKRFIIYYLLCGIGAGLTQEIGQFFGLISPMASTVGASGAVFGVMLAFGMTFPNEKLFIIPFPFPIKAKWFVTIYAVIELISGVHSSDGVAHYAHLGGMVVGIILILLWRRQAKRPNVSLSWAQKKQKAPEMNVSYGGRATDYEYNARKRAESEEIDRILEKIRQNGYNSLSAEEKARLFDASKR